jgi:FMN phosphatase YigB (HAD superfamily)
MTQLIDILKQKVHQSTSMTNHHRIKAILFDAADILYYRPHDGQLLKSYLQSLGLEWQKIPSAQKQILQTQAFEQEISIEEYYTELLKLYGIQEHDHLEAGKNVLKQESDDIAIFDGVKDTLLGLKERGFLLGIVTDTALPIYKKLLWFEEAGFGHVWDAVTSSRDIGIRKPNPGIYHAALRQLGATPEQTVFVGHHPAELQGADAVGLTTIAFNYEDDVKADRYVEHFADLLEEIENL